MKKRLTTIVVSMLTLIALGFSMVGCSASATNNTVDEVIAPEKTILAGGMYVGELENHGIQLMSSKIEPNAYADYGIMPTSKTAFTLNATISPEDAANHGVDWFLSFENPSSTWASGKNVEDYVIMNPSVDTKSNTISCLQLFGNAIILTAKSQDNPDLSAICRFEYSEKVTEATLNIGNLPINIGGTTEIKYEVSASASGPGGVIQASITSNDVYTIAGNYSKTVTFSMPSDTEQRFHIKDHHPAGMKFAAELNQKNWYGLEYYFDYNNDIKDWMIVQRAGDIVFKNLNTAQIIDYFSNITCNKLGTIHLTLTGRHNKYEYSSELICTGYTNNTPVKNIALSQIDYIF